MSDMEETTTHNSEYAECWRVMEVNTNPANHNACPGTQMRAENDTEVNVKPEVPIPIYFPVIKDEPSEGPSTADMGKL
jgi:hypothetical protein